MLSLPVLTGLFTLLSTALAADNNSLRQRRIYQLVTDRFATSTNSTTQACNVAAAPYCGGSYQGIINQLGYIQGMGFDTIWISPIVQNIGGNTPQGQAYHGYWTLNPDNLNTNFGTAADLTNLASALHARGMYLMLDIVINHVAATSSSTFQPSSSYGPFSATSSYHPFCWITDYSNQTNVEYCWLGNDQVALPDLNTESQTVISYWNNWIKKTISTYSIDYIRIDTVKHIPPTFWTQFMNNIGSGTGNVGEVLDGDASYVGSYQKSSLVNPFNYPIYYPLVSAFNGTGGNLTSLINMVGSVKTSFSDPTLAGGFLNNQDNPRFESFVQDQTLIKNAHTYSFVSDSVPYLYYGSEAGFTGGADPMNREPLWTSKYNTGSTMYKFFTSLNAARSAAGNASTSFYTNQMSVTSLSYNEVLISKPPLISVLSNRGSSSSNSTSVNIPQSASQWGNGISITDAISCSTFNTGSNGALNVNLIGNNPMVLIETSKKGNVCTAGVSTGTGTSTGKSGAGGKVEIIRGWMGVVGIVGMIIGGSMFI